MTLDGVLQPRDGGTKPTRDRDPVGVGRDRLKALQLHRAREERGAVLLLPEIDRLSLIRTLQKAQVLCDHGVRHCLRGPVELGKQLQDRQRLEGRAVGLSAPVRPWRAADQEGCIVRRSTGVLADLRELDVVDQRLCGRERARRQLDRDDRGITRPVVDIVLGDVRRTVLPRRRGEHAPGFRQHTRVHGVLEHEPVRRDVAEHQPEHVLRNRRQIRLRKREPDKVVLQCAHLEKHPFASASVTRGACGRKLGSVQEQVRVRAGTS